MTSGVSARDARTNFLTLQYRREVSYYQNTTTTHSIAVPQYNTRYGSDTLQWCASVFWWRSGQQYTNIPLASNSWLHYMPHTVKGKTSIHNRSPSRYLQNSCLSKFWVLRDVECYLAMYSTGTLQCILISTLLVVEQLHPVIDFGRVQTSHTLQYVWCVDKAVMKQQQETPVISKNSSNQNFMLTQMTHIVVTIR